jgi:hypothetical protein
MAKRLIRDLGSDTDDFAGLAMLLRQPLRDTRSASPDVPAIR